MQGNIIREEQKVGVKTVKTSLILGVCATNLFCMADSDALFGVCLVLELSLV